jgi:hypothetical protein
MGIVVTKRLGIRCRDRVVSLPTRVTMNFQARSVRHGRGPVVIKYSISPDRNCCFVRGGESVHWYEVEGILQADSTRFVNSSDLIACGGRPGHECIITATIRWRDREGVPEVTKARLRFDR